MVTRTTADLHTHFADSYNYPTQDAPKPPLNREALRDVIDLALWAGQLLLANGADTARVEETVHHFGTGLGASWMDILVSPNAVVITTSSGEEFRTKVRRVVTLGVNMAVLDEVNRLSHRVAAGEIDRFGVRHELERIGQMHHGYNPWLIAGAVGIGCGAFSQMFAGDAGAFLVTFVAAAAAMRLRQLLQRQHFNPLIIVILTAFAASAIAALGVRLELTATRVPALAASVLLLVPGVHLINGAQDMLKGHMVTGIVRGMTGALISACIAVGVLLALGLLGVARF
jgi:uncharacterized membrane protein YjjP (DUF1212 family)